MNTAPAFFLHMLLLLSAIPHFAARRAVVPKTGIYIVTAIAVPYRDDLAANISVNDKHWFTLHAKNKMRAGFDAAFPLKEGDYLKMKSAQDFGAGSKLGVVFVTTYKDSYDTALCFGYNKDADTATDKIVKFQQLLYTSQKLYTLRQPQYTFIVQHTGIYWVTLRIYCQQGAWAEVATDYFKTECRGDYPVSVSGAYHITAGKTLRVQYMDGTSNLEATTTFSYVFLQGNNETYIPRRTPHLAYTAYAHTVGKRVASEHLGFDSPRNTDYGSMYSSSYDRIFIQVSGTYIVALRGAPFGGDSLRVDLIKNKRNVIFTFYAHNGHMSGQSGVFHFEYDDTLEMKPGLDRSVSGDTLFSIALAWKEP